jgi:alkanesulfonate monooxygenase SsuD/methylene tetrahydromethanopterin reductase-like flavin-dependent oxidoreductase (luciferase family)
MIATVDQVSDGRLDVGLGAGWNGEEHTAYGIPLPGLTERFDRFEEYCEVVHRLLTEAEVDHTGTFFTLTEARCEPKPVQRPRPPFVIGGRGERRTLPIVARWAEVWNYPSGPVDDFAYRLGILRELAPDRPVEASVQVDVGADLPAAVDRSWALVAAGAEHLVLNLEPDLGPGDVDRVATAFQGLRTASPYRSPNPQRTG